MSDLFKIEVQLLLAGSLVAGLETVASRLTGIHKQAGLVGDALSKWRLAVGGTAAMLAGSGILVALGDMAKKSTDLLDAQDKLQRSGVSLNDTLRVTADYYNDFAKKIPTATADQFLKTINELRSVTGDLNSAQVGSLYGLKLDAIVANGTGRDADSAGFNIYRAIEQKGMWMTNPAAASKLADAFAQDIIGSGGKLTPETFYQMAKRGGAQWMAASPEFLAGPAAVLAADMGGDTAGTAMSTFHQMMTGATTLSKQQFETMAALGLLDMSKVSVDRGGRVNTGPGAIRGYEVGTTDQFKWAQEFFKPALEAYTHGDKALEASVIGKIGRNRNTIRLLTSYLDQGIVEQIAKDQAIWRGSSGVDKAYDDAMSRNPKFVTQAFNEQLKSMEEALGGPMMKAAIPVMKDLTDVFTSIGKWANAHPEGVKKVAEAAAAVGVALIGLGAAAVVGAAAMVVGPVTAAVVAIGSIVVTLGALNWKAVGDGFNWITDAARSLAGVAWQKIVDMFNGILSAIQSFVSGLASVFSHSGASPDQYTGTARGGVLLHKQSYVPPSGSSSRPVIVHTALNVDGRTLAKAVGTHMALNSPWSSGSSTFDGSAMPPTTDMSFA